MRRRLTAALAWIGITASLTAFPLPLFLPAQLSPDAQTTAARLDDMTRSLTGNLAELRASEQISHHRLQNGIAACMRTAGLPYTRAPLRSFYTGFTDADLGYGNGRVTFIDSLTAHGRRHVLNELSYARLGATPAHTVRPADVKTYRHCRQTVRSAPIEDQPPGARLANFDELLEPAYRDPRVQAAWAAYRPCMKQRYGYDVGEDRSDFLFQPRFNRADVPVAGRPAAAAWTRGVAQMTAAFAADADCRKPAYLLAMRHVADGFDAWEARHRKEIAELRQMWQGRVHEAAKLPTPGGS